MGYDHIVLGSGASGLTAAIILAKRGFRVAVVEKAPATAPLLRGFSRLGVHLDTGFHLSGGLARGEVLDVFFRHLGIREMVKLLPMNPECYTRVVLPGSGRAFDFPYGYESTRGRLAEAFPGQEAGIDEFLRLMRVHFKSIPYLNFVEDFDLSYIMETVHGETLGQVLDRLFTDEEIKLVLGSQVHLHGSPPREVTMLTHCRFLGSFYDSVHTIERGGLALAEALTRRARELGVEFHLGQGAEAVLCGPGNRVRGVRLAGGAELASENVMATCHPSLLPGLLPPGALKPAKERRLVRLDETPSAHLLFLVAEAGDEEPADSCRVSVPGPEALESFGGDFRRRLFYVTCCGKGAGGRSGFVAVLPADMAEVAAWAGSGPGSRPAEYLRFKKDLAARLTAMAVELMPSLEGRVVHAEAATPLTMAAYCNTPHGSLYGVKHKAGQYNPLPMTKIGGLTLAGQAVTGPGVLGAMASAFFACGVLLGHASLQSELRECRNDASS